MSNTVTEKDSDFDSYMKQFNSCGSCKSKDIEMYVSPEIEACTVKQGRDLIATFRIKENGRFKLEITCNHCRQRVSSYVKREIGLKIYRWMSDLSKEDLGV